MNAQKCLHFVLSNRTLLLLVLVWFNCHSLVMLTISTHISSVTLHQKMFPPDYLQDIYLMDQAMVQQMVYLLIHNFLTNQLKDLIKLHSQLNSSKASSTSPSMASTTTSQITTGFICMVNRATIMRRIFIYKAEVKENYTTYNSIN